MTLANSEDAAGSGPVVRCSRGIFPVTPSTLPISLLSLPMMHVRIPHPAPRRWDRGFACAAYDQSTRGFFTVGVSRSISTTVHCLRPQAEFPSSNCAAPLFIFRTVFENILDGLAKRCRHWKMVRDSRCGRLDSIDAAERIFHFPDTRAKAPNR